VAGTAHIAAQRLREKLARIAAARLNVTVEQVRFAHGKVFAAGNPDNAIPFHRIAGLSHWSPGSLPEGAAPALRETAFWTPPHLKAPDEGDRIDSSGAYGFIFDFCGVEIDRDTGRVHIDRYVTMHDAGRILNPALVDGQIRGGFAHAVGAALLEEFIYGEDGSFQSGTLVDYLVPTACEVPDPIILHRETISPLTPLGAKGVGEGNCMSTPVCLANAVADALGIKDVAIPLTPARVAELVFVAEPPAPPRTAPAAPRAPKLKAGTGGRALTGEGASIVPAPPEQVWQMLIDPDTLAGVVPGCEHLTTTGPNAYRADVTMRVGPVRGTFTAEVALSDLDPPHALTLSGIGNGPLGTARGEGRVTLEAVPEGTRIAYAYAAEIGGKVAAIGGRMLDGAARIVIGQFFEALAAKAGGKAPGGITALIRRLLRTLGIGG
jgi:2-furoyl-CoA dehydrogenase large subunit